MEKYEKPLITFVIYESDEIIICSGLLKFGNLDFGDDVGDGGREIWDD